MRSSTGFPPSSQALSRLLRVILAIAVSVTIVASASISEVTPCNDEAKYPPRLLFSTFNYTDITREKLTFALDKKMVFRNDVSWCLW
jgi:hypothetical protein